MQYKYESEDQDYSDYSSGRVLYSLPGHPAFPVRLASEIFQRCLAQRERNYSISTPCSLYDPCCGAAYHLSVLGFLHDHQIKEIAASDVDEKAVALAQRNLGLLSATGMHERIAELDRLLALYQKDSHRQALASAHRLKSKPIADLKTRAFQANALEQDALARQIQPGTVDIVFSDVPYGQHSHWQQAGSDQTKSALWLLLDALRGILSPASIVALASDKQQKPAHAGYQRLEHFQLGKRNIVLLKPI